MVLEARGRPGAGMGRGRIAALAIAAALLCGAGVDSAMAQGTMNDALTRRVQAGEGKDRLLLEAKEIVYDNDNNTVSAVGDVELYYQGRTLQADRVTYDRKSGRVFARATPGWSRRTAPSSPATASTSPTTSRTASSIRSGSSRRSSSAARQPDLFHGAARRARRRRHDGLRARHLHGLRALQGAPRAPAAVAGEGGADHPQQRRADDLLRERDARVLRLPDRLHAVFLVARSDGEAQDRLPRAALHHLELARHRRRHPVLLGCRAEHGSDASADLPLAPGRSRPGRMAPSPAHRLLQHPRSPASSSATTRRSCRRRSAPRTAISAARSRSTGRFNINEKWRWGWDVAVLSDKWFLAELPHPSESIQTIYLKESVSTVYLQGQGDRSWFDARGYYFQGLSSYDWQKQLPVVHPVTRLQQARRRPARRSAARSTFKLNVTSLTREATHFSQIPNVNFGLFNQLPAYNGYYETCTVFQRGAASSGALPGPITRLSTELTWRRNYVDPDRAGLDALRLCPGGRVLVKLDTVGFQNSPIRELHRRRRRLRRPAHAGGRARIPLPLRRQSNDWGMHVLEPIGQVVARPNETHIGRLPNEDAQSLVFDDTIALRVGQVLRLRPGRGRRARQHRRAVHASPA